MAQKATKDLRDYRDPLDQLEIRVIQEARVSRASQGRMALMVSMERREMWAPREIKEIVAAQGCQVPWGPLDLKDHKELGTSVSVSMTRRL